MTDKRILENILSDQWDEIEMKISKRFCSRKEEALVDLNSPQAQVVIGVRRSGKSTLCYNVLHKRGVKFAYVNFDDERLANLTGEDLNDVLETLYKIHGSFEYLFIDEIQNIPEWHLFVNRLLRKQMHVLITGSNAKLLSSELATHLTGRHHTISLYPFSFAEYCDMKQVETHKRTTQAVAAQRAAFDEYLRQGGFPELQTVADEKDYITDLVDNILKRDIEQRFRVVHKAAFEQLAQHLLNVSPTVVVEKSLRDLFGFKSEHTAQNYISYLRQAYLLVALHKYSPKSKLRISGEKIYPVDVALMNKRLDAFAGENLGWRLETVVYIELLRRRKANDWDIYYYTDRTTECDFLLCKGNQTVKAIQVSYDISDSKTRKRETAGLLATARKTGCKDLVLLTDHQYEELEMGSLKITIRPVYDFLLFDDAQ